MNSRRMKYEKVNKTRKNKKPINGGGFFDFLLGSKKKDQQQQPGNIVQKDVKIGPKRTFRLNDQLIQCAECKETCFFKLDTSIDRSKTATIISDFVGADSMVQVASHPVKMLVCCNCYSCKFIYQSTTWNGIVQKIKEEPFVEAPPAAPAVPPPEQPQTQTPKEEPVNNQI